MKNDEKRDKKPATTEEIENESVGTEVERIEELENQVKRTLADYQNLEKRVQGEKREWIKASNKELLLRMLPVLDTLLLASKHLEDQNIKVSVAQFLDILKGEGVEKIETVGKDFDPNQMEAVTTVEVDPSTGSGQEEGKVVEEIRPGYKLYDKVLRPAQVKVGKSVS